ncbi:MAG: hypothetical protein JWQ76_5389 [Ramlibacter sp.]|nr:hypothetical protein [Ramlibacter sp.]
MTTSLTGNSDVPLETLRLARRQRALGSIFGEHFVQTFASPFLVIEDHVIESPVAIRFYKKDFSYLSKQLYLEYQYRSWKGYDAELLAHYSELVTNKLAKIRTLIGNTAQRLQLLLDQQGHQADLTLWPGSHRCDVPIIAAHARSYLDMLRLLDRVYLLAGTANLLGVIDSSQRAQAEYLCKKAVRAFRSILQTEVAKLYREAQRVVQEQHAGGQADPGMTELVRAQGREIAAFAASADDDETEVADVSSRGPSEDPLPPPTRIQTALPSPALGRLPTQTDGTLAPRAVQEAGPGNVALASQ